jgi:hypothetical protein
MQLVRTAGATLVYENGVVGTTAQQVSSANRELMLQNGVRIKTDAANTDNIYVGGPNVSATKGFLLDAAQELFVPIDQLGKVWVIGGAADQDYMIIAS